MSAVSSEAPQSADLSEASTQPSRPRSGRGCTARAFRRRRGQQGLRAERMARGRALPALPRPTRAPWTWPGGISSPITPRPPDRPRGAAGRGGQGDGGAAGHAAPASPARQRQTGGAAQPPAAGTRPRRRTHAAARAAGARRDGPGARRRAQAAQGTVRQTAPGGRARGTGQADRPGQDRPARGPGRHRGGRSGRPGQPLGPGPGGPASGGTATGGTAPGSGPAAGGPAAPGNRGWGRRRGQAAASEIRLRGAAARTAANMAASLSVPTATSVAVVPAKLLIDNRIVINNHLARGRGGKVSFTHLIGFAVVKALAAVPAMNQLLRRAGRQARDRRAGARQPGPGHRRDRQGRVAPAPGARRSRPPEAMDFRQFWMAYEDVVRKARTGKLTVDDFAGTTISLTNPGTIGTEHSVPRLMPGQGCIVGVGAMEYPAAYQGAAEETMTRLAISKSVTLTSTYDHRIIQGAQSGEFLRQIHQLLLGENGFWDEVFQALRIPYEPVRWVRDIPAGHEDDITKSARVHELIHAYRVRGHLMADTDPLEYKPAQAPRPGHQPARPDPVGPGAGVRHRRVRRQAADEAAGDPGRAAGLLLPHGRRGVHAHPEPGRAGLDPGPGRAAARPGRPRRADADPVPAERGRGVRDVPADQVRGPAPVLPGGRGGADPAGGRGAHRGRQGRAWTRPSSAWRTGAG